MTRKYYLIAIAFIALLTPSVAFAQAERLLLKYNDRHIRSKKHGVQTLSLKQEIRARYPDLDLSRYRLVKTVVMAKSKRGQGTLTLQVKDRTSQPRRVHGTPAGFNDTSRFNYDKIEITNPAGHSKGAWNLHFKGNFKLRKVLVVAERRSPKSYGKHNRKPAWDDDYRHRPYGNPGNGNWYGENRPFDLLPLVLPALNWGTDMEGEKRCGQRSGKVRDGWRYPNTICESSSSATFRKGYNPIRIFIRPDIRPLDSLPNHLRVTKLEVSLALDSHGAANTATVGMDIGGRNYTKYVKCNGSKTRTSFTINGNWHPADIRNAKIWVLPGHSRSDLTIRNMQVKIKRAV